MTMVSREKKIDIIPRPDVPVGKLFSISHEGKLISDVFYNLGLVEDLQSFVSIRMQDNVLCTLPGVIGNKSMCGVVGSATIEIAYLPEAELVTNLKLGEIKPGDVFYSDRNPNKLNASIGFLFSPNEQLTLDLAFLDLSPKNFGVKITMDDYKNPKMRFVKVGRFSIKGEFV